MHLLKSAALASSLTLAAASPSLIKRAPLTTCDDPTYSDAASAPTTSDCQVAKGMMGGRMWYKDGPLSAGGGPQTMVSGTCVIEWTPVQEEAVAGVRIQAVVDAIIGDCTQGDYVINNSYGYIDVEYSLWYGYAPDPGTVLIRKA